MGMISIVELANEILLCLDSRDSKQNFLRKLDRSGFTFGKFEEDRFTVRSKFYWESSIETPFIQPGDIDLEIRSPMNINYTVLEENIPFREINDFSALL